MYESIKFLVKILFYSMKLKFPKKCIVFYEN